MIPTILVVEENTLNLELARDVLIRAGLKVVEALILLDIRLPGMDGFPVLGHLKANLATASIPVVALAARAMVGDREQALAAGFSDYIPKPIATRTLAGRIRGLLDPGRSRRSAGGKAS